MPITTESLRTMTTVTTTVTAMAVTAIITITHPEQTVKIRSDSSCPKRSRSRC